MTDEHLTLDQAAYTIVAACSDRMKAELVATINATITKLTAEGHERTLVIAGAVSATSSLLYGVITSQIDIEQQLETLKNCFGTMADALAVSHVKAMTRAPEGVTVQ